MLNISEIARVLAAEVRKSEPDPVLAIGRPGTGSHVVLTFYGLDTDAPVISAHTTYGYFELHGLSGSVTVEPDEVIFFSESSDRLSGMVISSAGACSQFANVDRSMLSSDPSSLDPAHILAAMQLGLIELRPSV